jgi:NOL1/NOP2/fmu family ribosome biogenesis protein
MLINFCCVLIAGRIQVLVNFYFHCRKYRMKLTICFFLKSCKGKQHLEIFLQGFRTYMRLSTVDIMVSRWHYVAVNVLTIVLLYIGLSRSAS